MRITATGRGFRVIEFKDHYDIECTMQKSSLACEQAIWIGVNDPDPRVMAKGKDGWEKIDIPGMLCNTRMHLTQEQVKEILPYLNYFAENGELPDEELKE